MRLLIGIMLSLLIVSIAASVQSGNSTGKSMIPSGIAKNITNQTNVINLTNVTKQMNITNQTQMNISGLQRPFSQADVNESRMETPSQADFQSALSRYEWSSLGKDNDKHGEYSVP